MPDSPRHDLSLRVLLVDDHSLFLEGLRNLLVSEGIKVVGLAKDGLEALAQARRLRPDVILMDIQMPGLDGLEAIRRVRTEAGLAKTPIIALTALAMPGDRERCLEAGANDYLCKPVGLRNLLSAIEAQLAQA